MFFVVCFCLLIGAVVGSPRAHALSVNTSGFGLFKHKAGWNWDPMSSTPFSTTLEQRSGLHHLKFLIADDLSNIDISKARVGIVSGTPGAQPLFWFSVDKPYLLDASVQSPWASNLLAQAVLQSASFTKNKNGYSIEMAFDNSPKFVSAWDMYVIIDADGDDSNGFIGAEYLIQNTKLTGTDVSELNIAWLDFRPGILKIGEKSTITAVIHNTTDDDMASTALSLSVPKGLKLQTGEPEQKLKIGAQETVRVSWTVVGEAAGFYPIKLQVESGKSQTRSSQMMSVVTKHDAKREFQNATGAWMPFPERSTLQEGNKSRISQYLSQPSSKLKRNLFGITAHIYRSTNEEDPFTPAHISDGDLTTCWASRWSRVAVPLQPEWIQLDLKHPVTASEIRFLPAWKNSGMPAALKIEVSKDARKWDTVYSAADYTPQVASAADAKRQGDLTWQCFPMTAKAIRYVRLVASRLNQGNTSFFCAPMEPFQFRVGEIAVIDTTGTKVSTLDAAATSSSVHNAWYNSPETIKKTWPMMLKSGVKLNRIGQWGDKIDWATVEKTKGVYKIDPELDHYITESVKSGVDILMTLDYGNNLYQQLPDAPDFGPTWHRGHPFLQCAPTTPEAVKAFANYCAFMAKHFKGRVKYFEIWNEENGWFFDAWANNGNVEMAKAYGRALLAAAKAIKQANPDAIVSHGGTAGSSLDFFRIALDEGAGPYLDLVAFHPYGHSVPEEAPSSFLAEVGDKMEWKARPAEITDYDSEIAAFKDLVHKYNPKLNIWANEMNWFAPGEPANPGMGDTSELSQAKHLARFYSTNAWLGTGAIWWSLYNSNGIQEWAVIRSVDATPRAAYYSAGYVSTVLDAVTGAPEIKPEIVGSKTDDLIVKAYRNDDGQIIIGLWRKSSAIDTCKPVAVSLRIPNIKEKSVDLIDALYGYRQNAETTIEPNSILLNELLVGDWPLFVRINPLRK